MSITKREIYDVILDNKESDCYVIIDDDGLNKVVNKDLFEKVGD